MIDCVCDPGMTDKFAAMMGAEKPGGACADAPKKADGDTDTCKLDASSDCVKVMAAAMNAMKATDACKGMADQIENDPGTSAEEKKCIEDLLSANAAPAPAPAAEGADADLATRAAKAGLGASLLLLAGFFY